MNTECRRARHLWNEAGECSACGVVNAPALDNDSGAFFEFAEADGALIFTQFNQGGFDATSVEVKKLIAVVRADPRLAHLLDE